MSIKPANMMGKPMSKFGWVYKSGEHCLMGDKVLISTALAKRYEVDRLAKVVGLYGFVTVLLSDGARLDVDMRSLTFQSREQVYGRIGTTSNSLTI